LEELGLADVKRVAYIHPTRTAKPVRLTPRVRIMTEFVRSVMLPVVRSETKRRGHGIQTLSRRLRRSLVDGGRWLTNNERERLDAWVRERPNLHKIWEYRSKLAMLLEQRENETATETLSQWARAAQISQIGLLERFAQSLIADGLVARQS
jgi:stearoyl-CoA desaturase (delta-9 desaturase)